MKKLLFASALLSTNLYALDVKFNLEGRLDFINQKQKLTAADETEQKVSDSAFKFNRVRINAVGNINEQLSYRIRYTLLSTDTSTRDASTDRLEMYYIDHKSSLLTARIGKQLNSEVLGRESYNLGADAYINTRAYSLHHSELNMYKTGLSLIFKQIPGQTFTINAHTPNKTATDTTYDKKNSELGYGAYYSGEFLDKMIQPHLGYTIDNQSYDGAGEKNIAIKTLAAGNRLTVAGFVLDTEYLIYTRPSRSAANPKDETKSIYTNLAYTIKDFTPFLIYINDKYDYEGANKVVAPGTTPTSGTDYKRNAYGAGVHYKPFADVNFRYHVVYTTEKTKYQEQTGANVKEVNENKIIVGIKADI